MGWAYPLLDRFISGKDNTKLHQTVRWHLRRPFRQHPNGAALLCRLPQPPFNTSYLFLTNTQKYFSFVPIIDPAFLSVSQPRPQFISWVHFGHVWLDRNLHRLVLGLFSGWSLWQRLCFRISLLCFCNLGSLGFAYVRIVAVRRFYGFDLTRVRNGMGRQTIGGHRVS